MPDKPPIDAVIVNAIRGALQNLRPTGTDPSIRLDKQWVSLEQYGHIAGAIMVALDEAGYVIAPKQAPWV